jgi:anti-sigma factor RsiW
MNCDRIEALSADYLGNELDARTRSQFAAHLASCGSCREGVAALEQTLTVMQRLETVDDDAAAARTNDLRVVRLAPRSVRLGLALLRTAAVLGFGVLLGHYLPDWAGRTVPRSVQVSETAAPSSLSRDGTGASRPAFPSINSDLRLGASPFLPPAPRVEGVHPRWLTLASRLGCEPVSLAEQLTLLAESRRQ